MPAIPLLSRRTVRIGVTGLARAGKTVLLTSLWANLLAQGRGFPALPKLEAALAGRTLRVSPAPLGAGDIPAFNAAGHLRALAADPPHWPDRTNAVSLLAVDLDVGRSLYGLQLPPNRLRLEVLDYPGEWLLDLPLLRQGYCGVGRRHPAPAGGRGRRAAVAGLPGLHRGASGEGRGRRRAGRARRAALWRPAEAAQRGRILAVAARPHADAAARRRAALDGNSSPPAGPVAWPTCWPNATTAT